MTASARIHDIHTVLIVGAGAMGSQIGMVCALAGMRVHISDIDREQLSSAEAMLRARLGRSVSKGRLSETDCVAAFDRLTFTTDLVPGTGPDLVVEAVVEKLDVKRTVFSELDARCPERTILASNSSSFVPSSMASATKRPDRFCNIHFFNPALVMRCVEVVRSEHTSNDTIAAATAFVERIGKEPVVLDREIDGFIANRILNAIRDEATFLFENGYASIPMIDQACRSALGHPMGPYELQDLTGLDVGYHVRAARFAESGDERDAPSRTLAERFAAGDYGRKVGRGWYVYDAGGNKVRPTT